MMNIPSLPMRIEKYPLSPPSTPVVMPPSLMQSLQHSPLTASSVINTPLSPTHVLRRPPTTLVPLPPGSHPSTRRCASLSSHPPFKGIGRAFARPPLLGVGWEPPPHPSPNRLHSRCSALDLSLSPL